MGKRTILRMDSEYVNRYGLSPNFINKSIVLYDNRIYHIELHKADFINENSYDNSLNNLDDIIQNPDLISENINNNLTVNNRAVDEFLIYG